MANDSHPTFGQLLRRRREHLGLTQSELAGKTDVSVRMIAYHESGASAEAKGQKLPRADTIQRLANGLDLVGDERHEFEAAGQARKRSTGLEARYESSLPSAATPIIGREEEQADIVRLLRGAMRYRLVTLTGEGGIGKTRLALAVAEALLPEYAGRIWFADFARITEAWQIPQALATALGVDEHPGQDFLDTLLRRLRARHGLLILDNCEHLIADCATLAVQVLQGGRNVQILATSRQPLRLAGEQVQRINPLTLPSAAAERDLATLRQASAIQLFEARAQATKPSFVLTPCDGPHVAAICRAVDGIPLAIELVIGWLDTLTPAELSARAGEFLALMSEDPRPATRHGNMRSVIAWSYWLLAPGEQRVFRHLAVFGDDAPRTGIAAFLGDVDAGHPALLIAIERLVRCSLVVAGPRGQVTRFRLLKLIRAFGREQLIASGELACAQRRHCDWLISLAERVGHPLDGGPETERWLEEIEGELSNLRAALEWAAESDQAAGRRLLAALWPYWVLRHGQSEGRAWFARFPECLEDEPQLRAMLRYGAGMLTFWHDASLARDKLTVALALCDEAEDPRLSAAIRWPLAHTLLFTGDLNSAAAHLEEGWRFAGEHGSPALRSAFRMMRGYLSFQLGQWVQARRHLAAARREARLAMHPLFLCMILSRSGELSLKSAQYARARKQFAELCAAAEAARSSFYRQLAAMRLAMVEEWSNRLEAAAYAYSRCLEEAERSGNWLEQLHALLGLGRVALYRGEREQAAEYLLGQAGEAERQGGRPWRELMWPLAAALWSDEEHTQPIEVRQLLASLIANWRQDMEPFWLATCLEEVAILAADSGRAFSAAHWLGHAARLREETGSQLPPVRAARVGDVEAALRLAIGQAAFDAASEEGGRARLEELALEANDWIHALDDGEEAIYCPRSGTARSQPTIAAARLSVGSRP